MTFEFVYLGEFKFIFENILGYETESQTGSIDEKKKKWDRKSRASIPLTPLDLRCVSLKNFGVILYDSTVIMYCMYDPMVSLWDSKVSTDDWLFGKQLRPQGYMLHYDSTVSCYYSGVRL
jgi:hypothetical protein